jgi:RimJ/RimL family protein N-acetyltransferase
MTSEVLTTPLLVLRTVSAKDADDIFRHIADWDVVKMLMMPPWPYTREDAIQFAASGAGSAIEYQGQVIGIVSIEKRDDRDTLGYWLGKAYWGRGLMSEAVGAVVRAHFENPGAAAVYSGYAKENPASWRVQQKIGFKVIGEELTHIVSRGEQVIEMKTLLTREEFEKASR